MKKYLTYAAKFALIAYLTPTVVGAEIGKLPKLPAANPPAANSPAATPSTTNPTAESPAEQSAMAKAQADVATKKSAVEIAKKMYDEKQKELKDAMAVVKKLKDEEAARKRELQQKQKAEETAMRAKQKAKQDAMKQKHKEEMDKLTSSR